MPAVAILGPRQCGKTTLAKAILDNMENSVYLDLERRMDLNKLRDPEAFFELKPSGLICLDEIQRAPELFADMRSRIDRHGGNGQFLVLGSASPQLIRQTSESLAGRISYFELSPFQLHELDNNAGQGLRKLWLRGGFPRSYLADNDRESLEWRQDFIRTILERDIPQLGLNIPARRLERFWRMCAHVHGQLLNRSSLGESLGVSHHTINSYIAILEQTYLMRVLEPYHSNLKKRLVKSPKLYLRDSGILHALLDIRNHNDLLGHPAYGASWEGLAIENIISAYPGWKTSFYRSASGAEIDLILERGRRRIAVEVKASTSPEVKRSYWNALDDLNVDEAWIVAPVREAYPYKRGVSVRPLDAIAIPEGA
ncbi:ATP-binding protein [Desulfosarcina sp.]|uniref:ATP-binding protein n=1 Tax=Desulfosarcina sp. TaxID=2027861 RepID=UPI0029B0BDCD|nr:ATP-binding protein [Desulfosarcina sp.]MDX2455268.1 ATP-binding protein [Desulfosarcina sp.]